jgi:tetratricopeptide (TPR) repeat protein
MSVFCRRFALVLLLAMLACTVGCSLFASRPEAPPVPKVVPDQDMLGAIRAAGQNEKSVIDVNPLRDAGVSSLQDDAKRDEQAGRYADAAAKLDQAIRLSPEAPDLLQDRAEVAISLKDFTMAEHLAHQSWSLGPRLGPLCARNWQTVVEMRLQAGDAAGAATARKWLASCHKAALPRY